MKRISYFTCALGLTALAAITTSACTSDDNGGGGAITEPSLLSNEFTGTLTLNGAASYPFTVLSSGTVTGKIESLSPDITQLVGFGIGVWDGFTCQASPGIWNDRASQNTIVQGQVNAAGSLCVRIYDSQGTLAQPQTYDITVTHP